MWSPAVGPIPSPPSRTSDRVAGLPPCRTVAWHQRGSPARKRIRSMMWGPRAIRSWPPPRPSSFPPAPTLLPRAAPLQQVAEPPLGHQLADALQPGAVARLRGDGQLDVVLLALADHLVGLGQRPGHRLFEEDVGAGAGAGDDHVAVR